MAEDKRIHLLQSIPFFGAISDDGVAVLLKHSTSMTLSAGEIFFSEGDEADSLYILEKGQAVIYRTHQETEYIIREIEDGACFGDMGPIDLITRGASVRAKTECQTIKIPNTALRLLYEHDSSQYLIIQMNIAREMSRRVRNAYDQLFQLQIERDQRTKN